MPDSKKKKIKEKKTHISQRKSLRISSFADPSSNGGKTGSGMGLAREGNQDGIPKDEAHQLKPSIQDISYLKSVTTLDKTKIVDV